MKKIIQNESWINEIDLEQLKKVISLNSTTENIFNKEFEYKTSEYIKSQHANTICNHSCAILCCLKALNIGFGDEVIVPNIAFFSTATSIILSGAKIRLVDVNPTTGCLDPLNLIKAINEKTKAVVAVHLYGISCEMDELMDISKDKNIYLIEDAAKGIGVKYKNKNIGTFGEFGVLSYHDNQTINKLEGAIVLTDDLNLSTKFYKLKNNGKEKEGEFLHETIGWDFSLTELQAALALSQMNKLDQIISLKKSIFDFYDNSLNNEKLQMRSIPQSTTHPVHWFSNLHCEDAEDLELYLSKLSIPTKRFYYPLNKQPCFKGVENIINVEENFFGAEFVHNKILSLPSSVTLDQDQKEFIVNALNKY